MRTQHETAFSVLTQLDPLAGYRHTSIHDAEDEAGTEEEIARIIALGIRMKAERGRHPAQPLAGQCWGLIFSKAPPAPE